MKKKLRIAEFFSSDPSLPGGVQEHVYYLSRSLSDLGHRVSVFMPLRHKNLLPYPNPRPVGEYTEIPLPIGYDLSYLNRKVTENYSQIFSVGNFDLLHIHDPFMPFLSWELLNNLSLPIVTTYHATWEKDSAADLFKGFVPLFKERLSNKVKGAIFVSRRTQECWKSVLMPGTPTAVIPNGVDRGLFIPRKKTKNSKINILFLARIVPKKGLQILLKAVKRLVSKRSDISLSVVGTGPDLPNMKKYVKKNGLERNVTFHGYVEKEEKPEYFHKADIFCAPYKHEGFGITILESMATGTPIVAFRNNAFEEVLKNYPAGELIITKKNPKNLEEALCRLIDDRKLNKKIVKWEVKEIEKYGWMKIGKETEDFYYKVLEYL